MACEMRTKNPASKTLKKFYTSVHTKFLFWSRFWLTNHFLHFSFETANIVFEKFELFCVDNQSWLADLLHK